MKFSDRLKEMSACGDAVKWVGKRGPKKAYTECNRPDWLLWYATKRGVDKKLLVLAACDCAETALQFVPDDEDRPRKAIETARAWCKGRATISECRDAAYAAAYADDAAAAAYAAAYATYATYAAAAADAAAAYAADAAAYVAYADDAAATYAADAADAADASRGKANKHMADLVRARIPYEVMK